MPSLIDVIRKRFQLFLRTERFQRLPLRVTATVHPTDANRLLVNVADHWGPVTGLNETNFSVVVWAAQGVNPGGPFHSPQITVHAGPLDGFYRLDLGAIFGLVDQPTPDELGAKVFGLNVSRPVSPTEADRGGAIAVTPRA